MAGRGRGNFKPGGSNDGKFKSATLSQLTNIQGPRANTEELGKLKGGATEKQSKVSTSTKYDAIEKIIYALNDSDDGILLNQKIKFIIETIEKTCSNADEIQEALNIIHRRGLYDAAFASKLVSMLSSISFTSLQVHNIKIRNQFIQKLQQDFDNARVMQSKSPIAFRNAVRMLGEYYHKARLSTGGPMHVFTEPLCTYLKMLLESSEEEDLELFALQLLMNGPGIKSKIPDSLNEITLQARKILASNTRISCKSKIWLLLALDVTTHDIRLFPNDLKKFYISSLGDKVGSQFERFNIENIIQNVRDNDVLDKIVHNIDVIKMERPVAANATQYWENMSKLGGGDSFAPSDPLPIASKPTPHENYQKPTTHENYSKPTSHENYPKPTLGREKYLVKAQTYKKISSDNVPVNNWGDGNDGVKRENQPRAILGVGATLQKMDKNAYEANNWRERRANELIDESGGRGDSVPGGWGVSEKDGGSKSWSQHDDRTETDYTGL